MLWDGAGIGKGVGKGEEEEEEEEEEGTLRIKRGEGGTGDDRTLEREV